MKSKCLPGIIGIFKLLLVTETNFSCTGRIVYFAVDPFGCFGVFGNAMSFFTTISFPYEVGTFILITFYW
jgi:hypothetical protein